MVKQRSPQQVLEDFSNAELGKFFSNWIVNKLNNDFGFDFEIRMTNETDSKNQEVSKQSFYVQNKSSAEGEDKAIEDLSVDDWILFSNQIIPVVLLKYNKKENCFYWLITQEHVIDVLEKENPNWKRQKTKRVVLTNKLTNLDELKEAIIKAQKRIIRVQSLNLGIGEGIRITQDDINDLTKHKEKLLVEYKALTLNESLIEAKKGNSEKSFKLLLDVYTSPKKDEAKVRSIIGIIFALNLAKPDENLHILKLADEGIELALELGINYLKDYITILKNQAILFQISKKITEIQLSLQVQKINDERAFSFFYTVEFERLNKLRQSAIDEINNSLKNLLDTGNVYYYIASLPTIIDAITFQVMEISVFDRKIIDEEKEGRKSFLDEIEVITNKIDDKDLLRMIFRSLSHYHYWTLSPKKAEEYLKKAIIIAEEDKDHNFVVKNTDYLEQIIKKQNPYHFQKNKSIDEMTTEEYQKITGLLIEQQGIDINQKNFVSKAVDMALRDMNPEEYFKFCEHLYIAYLNTSPLGRSIGLPSLGSKLIWCEHAENSLSGIDLKNIFESFKEMNCKNCEFNTPRESSWNCTVKWVESLKLNPKFKKVIEDIRKNR